MTAKHFNINLSLLFLRFPGFCDTNGKYFDACTLTSRWLNLLWLNGSLWPQETLFVNGF